MPRVAVAQPELQPGASGVTVGSVTEITDQYLRIQAVGEDLPHRHWFKWAGAAVGGGDAAAEPAMRVAVAKLKVGDRVTVRWAVDDRRRIESVRLTSEPEPA